MNSTREQPEEEDRPHYAHVDQEKFVDDVTEFEKTTPFSRRCYKVSVRLGEMERDIQLIAAIFETVECPNLIRDNVSSPDS